ncbi:alkyl sulfatase C-terminal domain-containing protein [Nocardia sp. NPDC055029]
MELRDGVQAEGQMNTDSMDTILAMPVDLLFDYAAVHIDGPSAAGVDLRVNFTVKEPVNEDWTMWVRHGVLNARRRYVGGAQLRLAGLGQCTVGVGDRIGRFRVIAGTYPV